MKKTILFLTICIAINTFGQTPELIPYQAIVRNNKNELIKNKQVNVLISIIKNSISGAVIYTEMHTPVTNENGLLGINIGGGKTINGYFKNINWGDGAYFVKTDIATEGGTTYNITSTSQLLSVPYALHAKTAEKVIGGLTSQATLNDILKKDNSANAQIKDLQDPTDNQDAVTKAYVDALKLRIEVLENNSNINPSEEELLKNGFIDKRDNNHYNVVKIDETIWMSENLKYLPNVTKAEVGSKLEECYYVYGYNGTDVDEAKQTSNYNTYGVLYNSATTKNACPDGWRIPTGQEMNELIDYLGGEDIAGGKLKEKGVMHWQSPNEGATNESGFNALPAGLRHFDGDFRELGISATWWSTSASCSASPYCLQLSNDKQSTFIFSFERENGFSVRCVKKQ